MARVVLENLYKSFVENSKKEIAAVAELNLTIESGEFMVLVGPSGCGKSTTLRLIAGLETATSGQIRIGDRDVTRVPPKDRDIAMVFQNYALYPHMSVRENLAFGLKQRGLPAAEIARQIEEAAQLLGLTELLARRPAALSGGQRQRVALGRAIVRHPQVFLFDEPLSNLDAKMRAATRAELIRLHTRLGATMIYVTHDQMEAMTMGQRICVMEGGRILQVAPPLEVYHRPAHQFVAGFIGNPAMNFLTGRIAPAEGLPVFQATTAAGSEIQLPLPADLGRIVREQVGREVQLGIRPEHLRPVTSAGDLIATVAVVEAMGPETLLHLEGLDPKPLIARVAPDRTYAPGQSLSLRIDAEQVHLFDRTSGQSLRASTN